MAAKSKTGKRRGRPPNSSRKPVDPAPDIAADPDDPLDENDFGALDRELDADLRPPPLLPPPPPAAPSEQPSKPSPEMIALGSPTLGDSDEIDRWAYRMLALSVDSARTDETISARERRREIRIGVLSLIKTKPAADQARAVALIKSHNERITDRAKRRQVAQLSPAMPAPSGAKVIPIRATDAEPSDQ